MGPDVEILKASTSKTVSHYFVQLLVAPDVWRGDLLPGQSLSARLEGVLGVDAVQTLSIVAMHQAGSSALEENNLSPWRW